MSALNSTLVVALVAVFSLQCQPIEPQIQAHVWQKPLIPSGDEAIGFGPYPLGGHALVQTDSNAIGLRHARTGQLLWNHVLPPGWLNDVWLLEEVGIEAGAITLFHQRHALVLNPQGQAQMIHFPFPQHRWTTRMGHHRGDDWWLPVYGAEGVWLLHSGDNGQSWDSAYVHLNPVNNYGLIDGIASDASGWVALLRTWDVPTQQGAVALIKGTDTSTVTLPVLAKDVGNGHPVLLRNQDMILLSLKRLLHFNREAELLQSFNLQEPANLSAMAFWGDKVLVLHQTGGLESFQLITGLHQTGSLGSVGWVDRLHVGPQGPWTTWGKSVRDLLPLASPPLWATGPGTLSQAIVSGPMGPIVRTSTQVICLPL